MEQLKYKVACIFGVIGSFIINALGGWTMDLTTLLCFMTIDYLSGLLLASVFKKSKKTDTGTLSSNAGWKGLCKKGVSLMLVLVAHRIDITFGFEYVRTATVLSFIVVELISIIENAGMMGIPIPKVITDVIEVLRKKEGEK